MLSLEIGQLNLHVWDVEAQAVEDNVHWRNIITLNLWPDSKAPKIRSTCGAAFWKSISKLKRNKYLQKRFNLSKPFPTFDDRIGIPQFWIASIPVCAFCLRATFACWWAWCVSQQPEWSSVLRFFASHSAVVMLSSCLSAVCWGTIAAAGFFLPGPCFLAVFASFSSLLSVFASFSVFSSFPSPLSVFALDFLFGFGHSTSFVSTGMIGFGSSRLKMSAKVSCMCSCLALASWLLLVLFLLLPIPFPLPCLCLCLYLVLDQAQVDVEPFPSMRVVSFRSINLWSLRVLYIARPA